MKKTVMLSFVFGLLVLLLFSSCALAFLLPRAFDPQPEPPGAESKMVKVFINENPLLMDVSPVVVSGRTFVPMRAIFEALGAVLTWDGLEQGVVARSGGKTIQLWIGKTVALANGVPVNLDAAPFILENRTMVPLRFIGEAMGYKVQYDGVQRLVSIFSGASTSGNGLGAEVEWETEPEPTIPLLPGEMRLPLQRHFTLTLRPAAITLKQGELVTFEGYLTYTTSVSATPTDAAGKEIKIYQLSQTGTGSDPAILGKTTTDSQGYFYYKLVPFDSMAYYAVYDGVSGQEPVKSSYSEVTVEKKVFIPFKPLF